MSDEREKPTTSGEDDAPSTSVAPRSAQRLYGDAETARILETAVELQERARAVGTDSAHGLTVEDLRQIAQEVGIDPRFVDIAVSDVQGPVERHKSALAGGPLGWRFHSEVVGKIDDDDRGQILQAVRSVMGAKGEFADIYGRMEWIHDDGLGAVVVGISTKDDKTEIDVSATRSGEAGLLFGLGVPMGGLVSGAALANLFGVVGTGAAPAIAAAMAGVAYGVLRLVWRARTRWWEGRLQRITDQLSSTIQNVAVAPVEEPEEEDLGSA